MRNKTLFILSIFLLGILLGEFKLYAGKVIDKSSDGYFLFLPKTKLLEERFPVLICLPGWGVAAKDDIHQWTFPAAKNGFLVVGMDINYDSIHTPSDIKRLYHRIMKIINSLSINYPADIQRVYIAGTSAGGMMSIALALMYPGKFAAVGVVSGGRLAFGAKSNLRNARGCHFYMIHGEKDKSISIREFYSTKRLLEKNGAIVEFNVFPQGEHVLPSSVYRKVVDWLGKVKRKKVIEEYLSNMEKR
jgi:predicted esterase